MRNKKFRKNKFSKTGGLAISEILILILGTIAVAYILGSEVKVVSARGINEWNPPIEGDYLWAPGISGQTITSENWDFYVYKEKWYKGSSRHRMCPISVSEAPSGEQASITDIWNRGYKHSERDSTTRTKSDSINNICFKQLFRRDPNPAETPPAQAPPVVPSIGQGAGTGIQETSGLDLPDIIAPPARTNRPCQLSDNSYLEHGECHPTEKPKYCDNGILVNRCLPPWNCGCPSGQECQSDGTCKTASAPQNDNGNGDSSEGDNDGTQTPNQPRHLDCFVRDDGIYFVYLTHEESVYNPKSNEGEGPSYPGWFFKHGEYDAAVINGYTYSLYTEANTNLWRTSSTKGHDNCDTVFIAARNAVLASPLTVPAPQNENGNGDDAGGDDGDGTQTTAQPGHLDCYVNEKLSGVTTYRVYLKEANVNYYVSGVSSFGKWFYRDKGTGQINRGMYSPTSNDETDTKYWRGEVSPGNTITKTSYNHSELMDKCDDELYQFLARQVTAPAPVQAAAGAGGATSSSFTPILFEPVYTLAAARELVAQLGSVDEDGAQQPAAGGGTTAEKCDDGTEVGRCSQTLPFYCNEQEQLVPNCKSDSRTQGMCACPSGSICQSDGNCAIPTGPSQPAQLNTPENPAYCSDGTLEWQCNNADQRCIGGNLGNDPTCMTEPGGAPVSSESVINYLREKYRTFFDCMKEMPEEYCREAFPTGTLNEKQQTIVNLKSRYGSLAECLQSTENNPLCKDAFPEEKAPATTGGAGTGAGRTFGFFSAGFVNRIKVSGPWIVGAFGAATTWFTTLHAAKQQIQDIFPWINEGAVEALANAGAVAIAGAGTIIGAFQEGGILSRDILGRAWGITLGLSITAVVAGTVITFLATYKKESQKTIVFECLPWQPEVKGENCDECNNNPLMPCSEYQCRSLGQACELVNTEESGKALCIWKNMDDSTYPTIKPLESALPGGYKYTPDNKISPPDRGVMIDANKTDTEIDCVPAFTPLSFGVELNEPGMCKIDIERKQSFEEMGFPMSSGLYQYNHTYALNVPGLEALEEAGIDIESGDMELYVKCQDANGNSNPAHFVFKFCVDEGPDETQPLIVTTDLLDGMPIAAGTQNVSINVYVNEPVEGCSWSHEDESYESMNDLMDCTDGDELDEINPQGLYTCSAVLDGISDSQDNKFYFRCRDLKGNTNSESYEFTIKGTRPLVISSAEPNATTIKDSTDRVNVALRTETSAGFNNGEATCYYKNNTQTEGSYIAFSTTGSYTHTTGKDLWLPQGSYVYDIKCVDLGGNLDVERIFFDVEVDDDPPFVVRAYHEDIYLKIITNEEATCVYDIVKCHYEFDDGIDMTTVSDTTHFTDWNTQKSFYIKCRDKYGQEPDADKCTIIVRPLLV